MAKFKYRLQSVLDIKEKMENQAKQEFAAARAALDTEIEKLEELKQRKVYYENKAEALLCGTLNVWAIQFTKQAILKMDEYIQLQQLEVRRAEKKLEAARQKLAEMMQDRKIHEKLKEHAFEEFLEELKKEESKEVDELTSYTYGQRIQEKANSENDRRKDTVNG